MFTHKVMKHIRTGKDSLNPGTKVDASDWKNLQSLERQGYLIILPNAEPEKPEETEKPVKKFTSEKKD